MRNLPTPVGSAPHAIRSIVRSLPLRAPPVRIALGGALPLLVLAAGACGGPTEPLTELPRRLSAAEAETVATGNAFALGLFSRLSAGAPEENIVFSPLSAFYSLGMVANGADGETLAEMRRVLGQEGLSETDANAAYRDLLDLLLGLDPGVELRVANSLWHARDLAVASSFRDLARRFFRAEVRALDFGDPASREAVNAWAAEQTEGRIPTVVDELSPGQRALLVNAVYFRGDWREAFDPSATASRRFRLLDGTGVTVPMMSGSDGRYRSADEFEAVELPYGRDAFVMTILLPPEGTAPAELLEGVDAATWRGWMGGFGEARIGVEMPKFEFRWGKGLVPELQGMGLERVFQPSSADFGRLEEGSPSPGFYLGRVEQEAYIRVDEEGTEVAAATSSGVTITEPPPRITIDRPFLFAVRERFSGTILFLGQVLDPSS